MLVYVREDDTGLGKGQAAAPAEPVAGEQGDAAGMEIDEDGDGPQLQPPPTRLAQQPRKRTRQQVQLQAAEEEAAETLMQLQSGPKSKVSRGPQALR